eukprot:jgi/Botrbrau1/13121/Bobra.0187s0078.1
MAFALQNPLSTVPRPLHSLTDTFHRSFSALQQLAPLRQYKSSGVRLPPVHAATAPRLIQLPNLPDFSTLGADIDDEPPERLRDVKAISYVSRRRLDEATFDPDEVDAEGLPLGLQRTAHCGVLGPTPRRPDCPLDIFCGHQRTLADKSGSCVSERKLGGGAAAAGPGRC